MHLILIGAAALLSQPRGLGLLQARGAGDDAAVLAFLLIAVMLMIVGYVVLVATIRTLSNRELPVRSSGEGSGTTLGATRFKGGAIFAVKGQRLQCSYPFAEVVVDDRDARISMRSRLGGLSGERVVLRDEVEAIRVSQRFGIPYVEFVDDVRENGVTRFYAGRTLVAALADRGWPVASHG